MKKYKYAKTILILLVLTLMSCATPIYEGKYEYGQGWRRGKIIQIGDGRIIRASTHDCRAQMSADALEQAHFAIVAYMESHWTSRIVQMPPDSPLKVGDFVYVNIADCAAELHAREPSK